MADVSRRPQRSTARPGEPRVTVRPARLSTVDQERARAKLGMLLVRIADKYRGKVD